jgi:adhesin transport system outer membrane protein
MRQFVSGRRTWLDVMNAVRESTSAQIDVVDARFGAQAAYARLALRSGRWRPDGKGLSQ